jgi:hypothetical protein
MSPVWRLIMSIFLIFFADLVCLFLDGLLAG